jgi:hypothetical protein
MAFGTLLSHGPATVVTYLAHCGEKLQVFDLGLTRFNEHCPIRQLI